jgi:hypothetical protein
MNDVRFFTRMNLTKTEDVGRQPSNFETLLTGNLKPDV